jgi:hypothetical protein
MKRRLLAILLILLVIGSSLGVETIVPLGCFAMVLVIPRLPPAAATRRA